MVNIQEKFHICSTILLKLDTFIEKESESKTHAGTDKAKVSMQGADMTRASRLTSRKRGLMEVVSKFNMSNFPKIA
jgi:hypothetical protein